MSRKQREHSGRLRADPHRYLDSLIAMTWLLSLSCTNHQHLHSQYIRLLILFVDSVARGYLLIDQRSQESDVKGLLTSTHYLYIIT